MNNETISITELSDSKEIMMRKTPKAVIAFLLIVVFLFGSFVVWACFAQMDTYFVAAGELSVDENTNDLQAIVYIPERNITDVEIGQNIELIFSAVSVTDYGKICGKITHINDSFIDNTAGRFFMARASIDNVILHGKNGDVKELKAGMVTEIHAITGAQSVFSWILNKLNLSSNN